MEDLALVSTTDLVNELVGRSTFAGVIIFSPDNHRSNAQVHEEFRLLTAACVEDTIDLLENAIEAIRQA
jgi:hypothetical protein